MRNKPIKILLLSAALVIAVHHHALALTRGIEVIDKQGKPISFYRDYHALVIGISDYEKWPKLPEAAKDAEEVAAKLKGLNYQVKLVLNPNGAELRSALNEMVYDMGSEPERGILLYFAGHGETESLADKTKMGYIIPKDCPLLKTNPKGFASHAVSMRDIESASMRIKSKHVLMLFDSCFSGALFSLVRAVPHDITEKSALPVRQYITAGREDEQVPDKSMFKRCFLLGLEGEADLTGDGYVTGSEMGMYLSDSVVNYSHRRQHPQFGKINNPDLDRGDFIFAVPGKKTVKAEEKPPEVAAYTDELQKLRGEFLKLQQLLEARAQSETKEKAILSERKELEEKIKRSEQEQQKEQSRIRDATLERERKEKELEAKLQLEAAEKKALEEELRKIRAEQEQARLRQDAEQRRVLDEELKKLRAQQQQAKAETLPPKSALSAASVPPQVASIPPAVTNPGMQSPKTLRSKPVELSESDLKKMLLRHNFYVRHKNEEGVSQNDFADNGDGTVTDRATGLMWQKGGSPSKVDVYGAKKYVEGLNAKKMGGHSDWRVPTLEELCSLLRKPRKNDDYTNDSFDRKQRVCWSADWLPPHQMDPSTIVDYHAIDFGNGIISQGSTGDARLAFQQQSKDFYFLKAVRTERP